MRSHMELTCKEMELIDKWHHLPEYAQENVIKVVELFTELIQSKEFDADQIDQ